MKTLLVKAVVLLILAYPALLVIVATHVTVHTYSGAGGQRGIVVEWRGHTPSPVQCLGYEYGTYPGPFVNVDC